MKRQVKNFSEFINERKKEAEKLRLCFVGDIMQHDKPIHNESFKFVAPILKNADICIGNLELIVTGENKNEKTKDKIKFGASEDLIPILKEAGFTHLSLTNNHSLDYGLIGFQNSEDAVGKHLGVLGKNNLLKKKGYKINILNFTTSVNDKVNQEFIHELTSKESPTNNEQDIDIAYLHWGAQYPDSITNFQKKTVHELHNLGYEIVIGSGTHNNQKIERSDKLSAYSLGDFISQHNDQRAKDEGQILIIDIYENAIDNVMTYETKTNNENIVEVTKRNIL